MSLVCPLSRIEASCHNPFSLVLSRPPPRAVPVLSDPVLGRRCALFLSCPILSSAVAVRRPRPGPATQSPVGLAVTPGAGPLSAPPAVPSCSAVAPATVPVVMPVSGGIAAGVAATAAPAAALVGQAVAAAGAAAAGAAAAVVPCNREPDPPPTGFPAPEFLPCGQSSAPQPPPQCRRRRLSGPRFAWLQRSMCNGTPPPSPPIPND